MKEGGGLVMNGENKGAAFEVRGINRALVSERVNNILLNI
jgi:hypothetical protein